MNNSFRFDCIELHCEEHQDKYQVIFNAINGHVKHVEDRKYILDDYIAWLRMDFVYKSLFDYSLHIIFYMDNKNADLQPLRWVHRESGPACLNGYSYNKLISCQYALYDLFFSKQNYFLMML